jgi:multidrug resistance efflux pump
MNEEQKKESIFKKPWIQSLGAIVLIFGALVGFLFWQSSKGKIEIENSYLDAPVVNLSPTAAGNLNALYVKEGDYIEANAQVALVGSQILSAKNPGVVISAKNLIGSYFAPGQTVVSVVQTQDMKVVGSLDETKGLKDVASGERATFTVDAFPGKKYEGIVDDVAATSSETGVAFSISDKRPVKKFNITVRFDVASYPELRNGMSAKITIDTRK